MLANDRYEDPLAFVSSADVCCRGLHRYTDASARRKANMAKIKIMSIESGDPPLRRKAGLAFGESFSSFSLHEDWRGRGGGLPYLGCCLFGGTSPARTVLCLRYKMSDT